MPQLVPGSVADRVRNYVRDAPKRKAVAAAKKAKDRAYDAGVAAAYRKDKADDAAARARVLSKPAAPTVRSRYKDPYVPDSTREFERGKIEAREQMNRGGLVRNKYAKNRK